MTLTTRQRPDSDFKLPIAGADTERAGTEPVTRATAQRVAQRDMPGDLKAAGYRAEVHGGQEMHDGEYRPCWRIQYVAHRSEPWAASFSRRWAA